MKISPLYDGETVRKKFEKVKISTSQRDAANVWLEKLESGELKDEVKNYEVFRETILRDLLGYPDSKLHFEEKDVEFSYTDNRDVTHVCIECKGTKTKDLFARQPYEKREQETPVLQTWSNMGRFNPAALYGICTNYQSFVLLDQKYGSSKCHKFDFMEIRDSDEKLREFVGLFSYKELVLEKTLEGLYKASSTKETDFTKEFYKLFHETRLMLIEAFKEKFGEDGTSSAIKYAQMYLNRLIFLFFAEDRGDVEDRLFTKRVVKILEAGNINSQSRSISEDIVTLFKQLDKGERARPPFAEIFAFNGGLFKEDIPPNAFFRDLRDEEFFSGVRKNFKFTKKLELDEPTRRAVKPYEGELSPIVTNLLLMDRFDFMKDIGVNIMGHILEQSISDLEELQGNKATKRKKDGVYYTPEYITEYICNNTIIPYLSEKDSNTIEDLISEYDGRLGDLENKMHSIRILDPACGSGAFLIKAAETLLKIDDAIQKQRPSPLAQKGLSEYQEEGKIVKIIEDCIFGVDINEEAVEIAKLSMFLRIAGPNRKLVDLSKNILIGNSLVDDERVDPKTAFNWEKNFPDKFDIVIGNPPYLKEMNNKDVFQPIINSGFAKYHQGKMDYWYFFIHRAIDVLKTGGKLSFITNSYWIKSAGSSKLIERIKENLVMKQCIDFGKIKIFEDVNGKHMIHTYRKDNYSSKDQTTYVKLDEKNFDELILDDNKITKTYSDLFTSDMKIDFSIDKISFRNCKPLDEFYDSSTGVQESTDKISLKQLEEINSNKFKVGDGVFVLSKSEKTCLNLTEQEEKIMKKYLDSTNVDRYNIDFGNEYLIYSNKDVYKKINSGKFPNIKKHLDNVSEFISSSNKPYGLHRPRKEKFFTMPKLICKGMFSSPSFCYDEKEYFVGFSFSLIIQKDPNFDLKYLLGIMNSNFGKYWFNRFGKKRGGGVDVGVTMFRQFPVFCANQDEQKQIIFLVEKLMTLYKSEKEKSFVNEESKLNELVYKLYHFSEDERKIIEQSV